MVMRLSGHSRPTPVIYPYLNRQPNERAAASADHSLRPVSQPNSRMVEPTSPSLGDGAADRSEPLQVAPAFGFVGGRRKRFVDIVLASTALVLAIPIMLIVSVAIWARMGGPIVFAQERVGYKGRRFRCFKFRTMATDADILLRDYLASDPAAALEWQTTCKLSRDPRVTPLGHILRKSSLDELPQLFNILRGDMSCVGPRPIVPTEIEKYGDHSESYLGALPGLTGPWQCSGRSRLSYDQRVALDVDYTKRWSLALDISIMLRTIPALLRFDQSA